MSPYSRAILVATLAVLAGCVCLVALGVQLASMAGLL